MSLSLDRQPVIVGVGEVLDRPAIAHEGREPMRLMLDALQDAERDAGVSLLKHIDALDVVREISWPYLDTAGLLAQHLEIEPPHRRYGQDGGESPIRFLHEAALRIQRGESAVAAVVGAEAGHTTAAAWKAGIQLPWLHRDPKAKLPNGRDLVGPLAITHGAFLPAQVYPFFENAAVAHWGQTQAQGIAESAELCSALSRTAMRQANSWSRTEFDAAAIRNAGQQNRMIAWPYTKRMVANPMVNQGAAFLLTSRTRAREWGIADERMIHVWGGAHANECRDYLSRDRYHDSSAQRAVLESVQQRVGADGDGFSALELYSCFPVVPKMARRLLGLPADRSVSVTGGLNFFGAPLNNYMGHATVAMVRHLRQSPDDRPGLLYGQGEYVTKHHAAVLSRVPDEGRFAEADASVQKRADALRAATPELLDDHEGKASIETFTVLYGRDSQPEHGVVIARTPEGRRLMARVPASDGDTMSRLLSEGESPIGTVGVVRRLDKDRLGWSVL